MNHLLDTNVVSELVTKVPNPSVVRWIDALDPESVYLSAITIGEVRKGIEKLPQSARRERLQRWLSEGLLARFAGRILVMDVPVMLTWGELVGRHELSGRSLPAMDSMIAAQALHHQCTLVTRNCLDFEGLGILLANPWSADG